MPRKALNVSKKQCNAQDDFAPFILFPNLGFEFECSNCGYTGVRLGEKPTMIAYAHRFISKFFDQEGIDIRRTILKQSTHVLGINCGCYSKFHRQVVHIQTAMKKREKNSK